MKRHFSKEDTQMASKQTNTTMLNITRHWEMDGNNDNNNNRKQLVLGRMWSNRNPLHRGKKYKMVQVFWKIVGQFLKRLNRDLPHDSAIPLLGI